MRNRPTTTKNIDSMDLPSHQQHPPSQLHSSINISSTDLLTDSRHRSSSDLTVVRRQQQPAARSPSNTRSGGVSLSRARVKRRQRKGYESILWVTVSIVFIFATSLVVILRYFPTTTTEKYRSKWSNSQFRRTDSSSNNDPNIGQHQRGGITTNNNEPFEEHLNILLPSRLVGVGRRDTQTMKNNRTKGEMKRNTDFSPLEGFGRHRERSGKTRTFGALQIKFLNDIRKRNQRREIYYEFDMHRGYDDLLPLHDDYQDYYYAYDDDIKRNPYTAYSDDKVKHEKHCRRTKFHRDLPINCNKLHEFDVEQQFAKGGTKFLGSGAYREVYLSHLPDVNDTVVFKAYYWGSDFSYSDFEFMRMDAIVAERLTWSPRIVDIYGFCGTGMINEAMMNGDMEKVAIPTGGKIKKPFDETLVPLKAYNNLTATQKLKYALDMVEAVLLLHGFEDGVIVHDDIQLPQFLLSANGELKLNDFNRAEIMLWNEKDQEYCRYRNNPGHGDWRAPEEYKDDPLNEKIDVWSLGNNIYTLLTGLTPFYFIYENPKIKKKIVNREIGFIDPRYQNRSFAEGKLAYVIKLCWAYDPDKRIDIFQLARILRTANAENDRRQRTVTG